MFVILTINNQFLFCYTIAIKLLLKIHISVSLIKTYKYLLVYTVVLSVIFLIRVVNLSLSVMMIGTFGIKRDQQNNQ